MSSTHCQPREIAIYGPGPQIYLAIVCRKSFPREQKNMPLTGDRDIMFPASFTVRIQLSILLGFLALPLPLLNGFQTQSLP